MAADFHYIKSRDDFFKFLDEMIRETEQKYLAEPSWRFLESVLSQLYHIRNTTAHGRKPTFEERKSVSMGYSASRELEGAPAEWEDFASKIGELSLYYKFWRTDAGLATFDWNDWRSMWPNEYDLSDEPDAP